MCDTAVRVLPDRVLFAKNSDRDPNEAQVLDWQPRRQAPPDARLRCTWVEVPEVRETRATLLSRPFWMWGAEMGANESGVVIGNEAVFTREPVAQSGLTGMDLLRLALERSDSAKAAVALMIELIETIGQGGGCGHENRGFRYHNSFLAADAGGAIVLETAGRHWATEEIHEGARSISNGLTIEPFAREHIDRVRTRVAQADARRRCTSAAAADAAGEGDLMRMLRSHGEGSTGPRYSRVNGAMAAPCVHAGGAVAASQTTGSWVSSLCHGVAQHWATGTSSPCTGLFKPVRVDEPLDLGPVPGDRFDDATLWWRHERLARAVLRDPDRLLPLYASERDQLEGRWLAQPPSPKEAFDEGERRIAEWTGRVLAAAGPDHRPGTARRYWAARDQRARLPAAGPL